MSETNDMDLVREYAKAGSDAAFAELVRRHINLVYSVALRFSGNSAAVEDIAQAVFIILAKKAESLRADTVLAGWLYETTRLSARQWLRSRTRRQHHEQEASMQPAPESPDADPLWQQLRPALEDAMSRLNQKERTLLALRFFENRTGAESAAMLGIGEWAARKRVARALEKLRRYFANHGVSSTTTILERTISANSVQVAPVTLVKSVTVVAAAKGAAASTSTLSIIKGALKFMVWTKTNTAIAVAAGLLIFGTGAIVVRNEFFPSEPSYQGRRLSEWLVDVDYSQPPAKRQAAGEAIRKMGARTLPFLLVDLGDENYKRIHYSREDKRTADAKSRQATWGFDALGPIAKPAIPELEKLLKKNPGYAPLALAGIGSDALPELLHALTNEDFWVRDNASVALGNAISSGKIAAEDASAAFPIALNDLTYTDTNLLFQVNTRFRAAGLLAALKQSPDVSIPALMQGLNDTNSSVAAECARALSAFGKEARGAIPALSQAANSTDKHLSNMAKWSLQGIQNAQ